MMEEFSVVGVNSSIVLHIHFHAIIALILLVEDF